MRAYFPDTPLIVDAGLGAPSHAAEAMEMGYDAVLLNTAIAKADDPVKMARALHALVEAGGSPYEAGIIEPRDMASPSTPVAGTPFFKIDTVLIGDVIQLDPFYPIVPDSDWLARLLPRGIKLVQLRIKDAQTKVRRTEIETALALCARHGCQLVVNDYWRTAIETGADFIHLGQEDLAGADLTAIRRAGIKFGISTHSDDELQTALAAEPDYVALGPIYPTLLEENALGTARPCAHRHLEEPDRLPARGIGGITPERAPDVFKAGADSVAVITDIVTHKSLSCEPEPGCHHHTAPAAR